MVAVALPLFAAAPAQASFHLQKVNEVMLASASGDSSAQFIELYDPFMEPFPPQPYALSVYDGSGTLVGSQMLDAAGMRNASSTETPYLISTPAADAALGVSGDAALTIALPAAGQACFEATTSKIDCITWGAIATPVRSGAPNGPTSPGGQSLQREDDGTLQTAAPTPKAVNTDPRASGPPPGGSPPPPTFRGAALGAKRVTVRRGKASVPLRCPAANGDCSGRITLTARIGRKSRRIGSAKFAVRAGAKRSVRVTLAKAARRALAARRRLSARARIVAHSGDGQSKTTTPRLTLVRAR